MKKIIILIALSWVFNACESSKFKEESNYSSSYSAEWPMATSYEIFVRSFADSNGDGIGDIKGMTEKLPYLQDLGIKGVWLMPIHPSPSYHKYDVMDYKGVHEDYGTLEDFKKFVQRAHEHDIKVVIDFVINHTARDHPWFQESMKGPDNPYRDYYVWAKKEDIEDDINKKETALDSDNIEQWHEAPDNEELYYGYFWGGMPDLNFDNPEVKREIFEAGKFWLEEVGVDGFRLDAARHIFPDERAADNHAFWVEFRNEMKRVNPEVYLVGEVWADMETVAPYLSGLPALFNFDMSYKIVEAVQRQSNEEIAEYHAKVMNYYQGINPNYIDATFITNHDQPRSMSQFDGDVNKGKLAASLLFTLPGAPYLYYGEEIGMLGPKPDPEIREPFLWKEGEKDVYRTRWIEAKNSNDDTVIPAKVQRDDKESLLNHYKRWVALRYKSEALSEGRIVAVATDNQQMAVWERVGKNERVLVIHNLSNSSQAVSEEVARKYDLGNRKIIWGNIKNNELGARESLVFLL